MLLREQIAISFPLYRGRDDRLTESFPFVVEVHLIAALLHRTRRRNPQLRQRVHLQELYSGRLGCLPPFLIHSETSLQLLPFVCFSAFDLTVGPDWILPSTDFSRVKKSLFIHARGPFGEALFSPDALAAAYAALLPRPRAAPEQLPRPESPLLLVELTGPLAERLLDLARAVLLSQKLSRRLVLLWDSADVGGVELGEIVDAPYLVLSPGELETAAALPPTELLTVTVSAVDVFSRPDGTEHVKVPDVSDVDASRIGEEQLNSMVGSLRPAFPLKEATHKLLVGRNFRGLLVDRSAPCDERALHASLKVRAPLH